MTAAGGMVEKVKCGRRMGESGYGSTECGLRTGDYGMNKIAISNLPILFTEYLYQPGYCFFNFFSFKMPYLVKKDFLSAVKIRFGRILLFLLRLPDSKSFVSNGIE